MTTHLNGPILDSGTEGSFRSQFLGLPLTFDLDYIVFFDDFLGAVFNATDTWTVVKDASAAVAIEADTAGGAAILSSATTTEDDGASIQGNEIFIAAAGKKIWFEARVKVSDADQNDMFVGLCENFATNPEAALTASNRIGFQIDDGNASILTKTEKVDVETSKDSEKDAADATYVKLGFMVTGVDKVEFFVNRQKVSEHTTNIPLVEMTPAFFGLSGNATGTHTRTIDYIFVAATR